LSKIHEVDPARPEAASTAIRAAAKAIRSGDLVVFPTETVYGLAARPDHRRATQRAFEAKRRPAALNLPVLAASASEALWLTVPTETASKLAGRFWPGPLTLVLPRSGRSAAWHLGEHAFTIAVRVPDHAVSLALLRATGPLATTSANISGRLPLLDPDDLVEVFGALVDVYLLLPAGVRPPGRRVSTVLDLTGPKPRVVREGPIDRETLRIALGAVPAGPTG
jgi:L-threonylcarbamoyladenylate synthase